MGVALIGGVFDTYTRTGGLTDLSHAFSVALIVVSGSYLAAGIAAGGFLKRH